MKGAPHHGKRMRAAEVSLELILAQLLTDAYDQDEANIVVLETAEGDTPPDASRALQALLTHALDWDEVTAAKVPDDYDVSSCLAAAAARNIDRKVLTRALKTTLGKFVAGAVRYCRADWESAGWVPGMRGYPR